MSKFNFSEFGSQVMDSKAVQVVKDNQVAVGVTTAYFTGGTLLHLAAGATLKTAVMASAGSTLAIGALSYGCYRLLR